MSRFVRITNPGSGPRAVARKIANRWVKRGWAHFVGADAIERADTIERSAIVASAMTFGCGYDRAAHSGCATRQQLKNLPMAGNVDRLLGRGASRRTGAKAVSA